MENLELLAVALGLSALAGINLYLTVFAAGMAIRFNWITLAEQYSQLDILAHPAVLIISGILFLAEFFADKVPWFDSFWDSVHTFIRPVGGALLAIVALGSPSPEYDVVVALLAGGVSLTTHSMKAGVRLVTNTSPEPFSNIGISLAEDALVVGGLSLIYLHPLVAFGVFLGVVILCLWLLPRMLHATRSQLWFGWRKLKLPAQQPGEPQLPQKVPHQITLLLHQVAPETDRVEWAIKAVAGKVRGVPKYYDVWLIALEGEKEALYIVSKRLIGSSARRISLLDHRATAESRFLSEALVVFKPDGGEKLVVHFDKPHAFIPRLAAMDIEKRIEHQRARMESREPEPVEETRYAPMTSSPLPEEETTEGQPEQTARGPHASHDEPSDREPAPASHDKATTLDSPGDTENSSDDDGKKPPQKHRETLSIT